MDSTYQARWISKQRAHSVKKTGGLTQGILLDTFKGFVIVEPVGSQLGDGPALSPEEADYELQPSWSRGPRTTLSEARKRLGLAWPTERV